MSALQMLRMVWHRKEDESDLSIFLMAGPISVFCSAVVGLQRAANCDLIVFAMLGMVLCMRGRMRGLVYSLIFFAMGVLIKHLFFIDRHLWQLALEGSMAIGFAMTALAVEMIDKKEKMLLTQIDSAKLTVRNLEEDLEKARQDAIDEQIVLQDRLAAIQKDFEDSQSDASAFQILNDVLRKSSAQSNQEREEIAVKLIEKDQQSRILSSQVEQMKEESHRFSEMIAEREFDLNRLQEQMHDLLSQQNVLNERLAKIEREKLDIIAQLDMSEQKRKSAEIANAQPSSAQLEREIQHWAQQVTERDAALMALQEKVKVLSQKEAQFLELKKQFAEKNQVLHQTRAELFRADTALQSIKIERENPSPVEEVLSQQISQLGEELEALEKENKELVELVGSLSVDSPSKSPAKIIERLSKIKQQEGPAVPPPAKKKKKKKKKSSKKVEAEQKALF
ncbi:MAG: hypothetical protein HW387_351 [Parachlamydiales bacterium]|nr:hypothetical protein [Parachlamydiales bacterium]